MAQTLRVKPKVPPGIDPGGAAIGLITTGIDYTLRIVARCLARDGEGELIGWDVVDRDRQPFAARVPGVMDDSVLTSSVDCHGQVRLVPVRIDPDDGTSLARALAFLSATPVKAAVVPAAHRPKDWAVFREVVGKFSRRLLVVVGDAAPAGFEAPANVAFVAGPTRDVATLLALGHAATLAACLEKSRHATSDGAELKKLLLEQIARLPNDNLGVLSPKCS